MSDFELWTRDELERVVVQLEAAVKEQQAEIERLRGERDEAREAAMWLYVESCRDPEEPVPPAEYFVVEKRWPWLEEENK